MENIFINSIFTILGILLLYFGGNFIVDGSVCIANRLKIAPIIIGLTVVAMGTSMPELFVSLFGAIEGDSAIAVGNVIGSNIFNIVFVLGVSALFMDMFANNKSYYISMLSMFIMYIALFFILFNFETKNLIGDKISIKEGFILIILLCLYVFYLYKFMSKDKNELKMFEKEVQDSCSKQQSILFAIIKVILAILFLAFGSDIFIRGVTGIFSNFISEHIIGFIVVAVGTSIPELVTSVVAAIKKNSDISIGNIVGSNIFNVGAVLGLSSIASFKFGGIILEKTQNYLVDFSFMFATGLLLLLFTLGGKGIGKFKGMLFLIIYIGYVIFLFRVTSV